MRLFSRVSVGSFLKEVTRNRKVLMYYAVPSGLYCIYNNLTFTNLASFDPTTYFMLAQSRLVVTGITYQVRVHSCLHMHSYCPYRLPSFQVLFKVRLSAKQWMSIGLLTLGCMLHKLDIKALASGQKLEMGLAPLLLVAVQVGWHR